MIFICSFLSPSMLIIHNNNSERLLEICLTIIIIFSTKWLLIFSVVCSNLGTFSTFRAIRLTKHEDCFHMLSQRASRDPQSHPSPPVMGRASCMANKPKGTPKWKVIHRIAFLADIPFHSTFISTSLPKLPLVVLLLRLVLFSFSWSSVVLFMSFRTPTACC